MSKLVDFCLIPLVRNYLINASAVPLSEATLDIRDYLRSIKDVTKLKSPTKKKIITIK